jgi:hypothetical protein
MLPTAPRALFLTIALFPLLSAAACSSTHALSRREHPPMTTRAAGPFEVILKPLPPYDASPNAGRFSIDKQFHGDLEATSKGEMLSAGTAVKGSAGYVAMERVTGTLLGRTGSFTFQHSATMTRGTPQLSITVVPDSGTDQLQGLTGACAINIADGKHFYDFQFALPAAH